MKKIALILGTIVLISGTASAGWQLVVGEFEYCRVVNGEPFCEKVKSLVKIDTKKGDVYRFNQEWVGDSLVTCWEQLFGEKKCKPIRQAYPGAPNHPSWAEPQK